MRIIMVGAGYVGLVTGACFAEFGNDVTCVDIDREKINKLKQGVIPIYEPGLKELVIENSKKETLAFSTSLEESLKKGAEAIFIAVGTPSSKNGAANLDYVFQAAKDIGKYLNSKVIVVDKSTVPVGTADRVSEVIREELKRRNQDIPFSVVSNPEFLKEGMAIADFMKPDRVVVGSDDPKAIQIMRHLYRPFTTNHERFLVMDIRSAELTKYAANALLAAKISFINEIANIAEKQGANINHVRLGIGSDKRIGYHFIYPGLGYGGSCFPKDLQALSQQARDVGYEPQMLTSIERVNQEQKLALVKKIVKKYGEDLSGRKFAIWGLSFKPNTDDARESAAVVTIQELLSRKARVSVYDPKAMEEAKRLYLNQYTNVDYAKNPYDCLEGGNALLLITEWKEFRSPDFKKIKQLLKEPVIFDGRNQYDPSYVTGLGIEYHQVGA